MIDSFSNHQIDTFSNRFVRTGTRIRTQIKGFGDPYATVAPCPYFLLDPYPAIAGPCP
jgi:hypothetical protein